MKKEYVTPTMVGERFSADEYVAACVTGTIQCAYPGASPNAQDDGTATFKDNEGKWHGSCGENAPISFDGGTGRGYEMRNGKIDYNRPIYDITGYKLVPDSYTNVSWTSTDGNLFYHHKGRLIITNIDDNRPNHS